MTREEFLNIRDWGDLKQAFSDMEEWELYDDIRSYDDFDDYISESVYDWERDMSWRDLGNYLCELNDKETADWFIHCYDECVEDWECATDPRDDDREIIRYINDVIADYNLSFDDDEYYEDEPSEEWAEVFVYEEFSEEIEFGDIDSTEMFAESNSVFKKISER